MQSRTNEGACWGKWISEIRWRNVCLQNSWVTIRHFPVPSESIEGSKPAKIKSKSLDAPCGGWYAALPQWGKHKYWSHKQAAQVIILRHNGVGRQSVRHTAVNLPADHEETTATRVTRYGYTERRKVPELQRKSWCVTSCLSLCVCVRSGTGEIFLVTARVYIACLEQFLLPFACHVPYIVSTMINNKTGWGFGELITEGGVSLWIPSLLWGTQNVAVTPQMPQHDNCGMYER